MEPILLNHIPLQYQEYGLLFYATSYISNGSLAIVAETTTGEPYATVSINLEDWGIEPKGGQIVLNHNLSEDFSNFFRKHFCQEATPIQYGYATSYIVKLKPEYIQKIKDSRWIKNRTTYLDRMEREEN